MPAINYVNESNATIEAGSENIFSIAGDDDLVHVGYGSVVCANGSALTATVSGAGDTVTANGARNSLWIGQNGTGAIDVVNGLTDGSLYEMAGSNVAVDGSNYTAILNGDDVLTATGTGVTITGSGAHHVVNVSGATFDAVETVTLADGGTVNANNSDSVGAGHLDVFGDHVTLRGSVFSTRLIGSGDLAMLTNVADFSFGSNGISGALDIRRTPGDVVHLRDNSQLRRSACLEHRQG